jgi:hypothetical protein
MQESVENKRKVEEIVELNDVVNMLPKIAVKPLALAMGSFNVGYTHTDLCGNMS